MIFTKKTTNSAIHTISKLLQAQILSNKQVLWLVSGGSNIESQIKVMNTLAQKVLDLSRLDICPMDERYGNSGHKDSNIALLLANGLDKKSAKLHDVLSENRTFEQTVEQYDSLTRRLIGEADVIVGQFGVGGDGHTAGILPNSPACLESTECVVGYEAKDYWRMTLTKSALLNTDYAFVLAYGENKKSALLKLKQKSQSVCDIPASLIGEIPHSYVYNDFIDTKEEQ